ncbi:MAG: 3,4-dihydroxy-2-butanone-4-phosphate synthase [Flavobacteriaceae bacterium]|nr:3,4-dihydroxy-2-butanone-4-phosphate synthase [Flavobacteriaceae bacterium]|tara:strand:- start:7696 stop:8829 length:1134 start_codon:yes stop_codon:yes gene_type:complete
MIKKHLNTIDEAISSIKKGEVIIVVDDEDRENEGDFLAAAEKITPQTINFMAKYGRGLICAPITEKRCEKLKLKKMVDDESSDPMETAFTVSVDLKGSGITTGISASDRSKTIRALVDSKIQARNFTRPGHVFPLIAKEGGVLRRTGHTEAAIDFARLAGFKPAGVISEIMNDDGSMARLPELIKVAEKFDLKIVSIEDLVAYRMKHDSLIKKKFESEIETKFGKFDLTAYEQTTNSQIHISLTKGNWAKNDSVLTRIHSSRISNDILTMLINKESKGINKIFELINKEGIGAIIFINQIEAFKDLVPRIKKLKKMQLKKHKVQTPPLFMDARDFGIGAQILHDLNINKLRIISNSSKKPRVGLTGYGLEIVEYVKY